MVTKPGHGCRCYYIDIPDSVWNPLPFLQWGWKLPEKVVERQFLGPIMDPLNRCADHCVSSDLRQKQLLVQLEQGRYK